jgi:3',5'-cyclic-AMP phosphodiesterase
VIIAQITDTHIRRKGKLLHHMVNPSKRLRRAVERINSLDPLPDVVLATGDLTDNGKRKEYQRLRDILAPLVPPLFVIPGNHDRREPMREAFGDHWYLPRMGPLQYVIEEYPVRLIGLDTMNDGEPHGILDEARLAWLDATLAAAPQRPTLIFMHHPPFKTGIKALDGLEFRGAQEFAKLVERNPQIQRIVCGHIHRAMEVRWHGTIACTALSTSHQFALELRTNHPLGIVLNRPGYAQHVWDDDTMVTHHCLVNERVRPVLSLSL